MISILKEPLLWAIILLWTTAIFAMLYAKEHYRGHHTLYLEDGYCWQSEWSFQTDNWMLVQKPCPERKK